MRFDPEYFIELCKQSGIELHREGPFICYKTGRKWRGDESIFSKTLIRHKNELMPLLPDTSIQMDLFDIY